MIVLGVLLCLSGAGVGLGLAVLAAGLSLSYAAWTLDDNPITRFVRQMANSIIGLVNGVIDAINDMFHIQFNGLSDMGIKLIPAFDIRLVDILCLALPCGSNRSRSRYRRFLLPAAFHRRFRS